MRDDGPAGAASSSAPSRWRVPSSPRSEGRGRGRASGREWTRRPPRTIVRGEHARHRLHQASPRRRRDPLRPRDAHPGPRGRPPRRQPLRPPGDLARRRPLATARGARHRGDHGPAAGQGGALRGARQRRGARRAPRGPRLRGRGHAGHGARPGRVRAAGGVRSPDLRQAHDRRGDGAGRPGGRRAARDPARVGRREDRVERGRDAPHRRAGDRRRARGDRAPRSPAS